MAARRSGSERNDPRFGLFLQSEDGADYAKDSRSLYYTGLTSRARVRLGDADLKLGESFLVPIDGMGNAEIEITIPAEKYAWAVFEAAPRRDNEVQLVFLNGTEETRP